jgi:hypothetical protein
MHKSGVGKAPVTDFNALSGTGHSLTGRLYYGVDVKRQCTEAVVSAQGSWMRAACRTRLDDLFD